MSRPMRLLAIRFASQGASMGEEVRRSAAYPLSRLRAKRPVPVTTRGREESAELGEPELDLAGGGLLAVRPVHQVLAVRQREVAADGAGGGLAAVRGAVDGPDDLDGLVALEHGREQRAAGHEGAQRGGEGAVDVLGVVRVGLGRVDVAQLERDQGQSLGLEAGQDVADQPASYGIGLEEDQGSLRHAPNPSGPASWLADRPGRPPAASTGSASRPASSASGTGRIRPGRKTRAPTAPSRHRVPMTMHEVLRPDMNASCIAVTRRGSPPAIATAAPTESWACARAPGSRPKALSARCPAYT